MTLTPNQMKNPSISRRELLLAALRSPAARILLSLVLLATSIGVIVALWKGRDLVAALLILALVIFSTNFAWELLPFSVATRARWQRSRQLDKLYPIRQYRVALWVGIGMAAPRIWQACRGGQLGAQELLVPLVFTLIGLIAHIIWHFQHQGAAARSRSDEDGPHNRR
jgi:hypothetical protein